jgi:hypothetical protein
MSRTNIIVSVSVMFMYLYIFVCSPLGSIHVLS